MLNCKICNKNLYKNITFKNMFRINYEIHEECNNYLVFNKEEEVIPIESNTIVYDYVFNDLNEGTDVQYLEVKYLINLVIKHIKKRDWSMMIYYDEMVEYFVKNYNPYLLINLTNQPILLISLVEKDISILEGL